MGLSNYLPSSRIAQPGVCTSTTRPATPYEGQVIYETDTNRVLVFDASAWVMIADTDQPPGLQLVKSQTIGTTVSSVTVSDVFSSEYENYLITASGGAASTIPVGLNMTLGSTNSGYYQQLVYGAWASTALASGEASRADWNRAGNARTDGINMRVELLSPNLAKTTYMNSFWVTGTEGGPAVGALFNTTQYTSFTITATGGTLTGGTIRVYGYRK